MNKKQKKIIRYSGIQPQYFPRLHYFARILNADIFAIRDEAQFVRKHKYPDGKNDKSYQAHTPIKQSFGAQLLTIPTQHEGFIPINETKISYDQDWAEEHLKTLRIAYAHALFFKSVYPDIENLLSKRYENLADLNIATILWGILKLLGEKNVTTKMLTIPNVIKKLKSKNKRLAEIKKGSESNSLKNKKLQRNEKIVALIKEFGANEDYCGGTAMSAYVDHNIFAENRIEIIVQDWKARAYPQQFEKQQGFLFNLSIIDLLMNVAPNDALSILDA